MFAFIKNKYNFLSLILFSFLPISFIFGNSTINLNIILIDVLFLFYCLNQNVWDWCKDSLFKSLFFLYLFLIFNSILSHYLQFYISTEGIMRSLTFIKFILLVYAFKILIFDYSMLNKIMKVWLIITLVFIFDIFFESFLGKNIFGYISPDRARIVSFFKDELIVGTFIFCFGSAVASFYLSKSNTGKEKIFSSLYFLVIPFVIFLTGERSIFIKSSILFFLILIFIDNYKFFLNKKIILGILLILITLVFNYHDSSKNRYTAFYKRVLANQENPNETINNAFVDRFRNIKYFAHYDTAIKIFKNYPLTGVGNKNFRTECKKPRYYNKDLIFSHMRCSTHPHQIHFEILSEEGIIGYIIILFVIFRFLLKNLRIFQKDKNIFHFSNIAYLFIFFIPLLPGAGIFSTFNGALFWIIFSLVNLNYKKN